MEKLKKSKWWNVKVIELVEEKLVFVVKYLQSECKIKKELYKKCQEVKRKV